MTDLGATQTDLLEDHVADLDAQIDFCCASTQ